MGREALAIWTPAAMALTSVRSSFSAPVHVLTNEAVELSRFCRDYWLPRSDGADSSPGLSAAVDLLGPDIADDLVSLQDALHSANTDYLLTVPPLRAGLRTRAEQVLSDLVAAVEWLLDDANRTQTDQALSALRQKHSYHVYSGDWLACGLEDYAGLASRLRARLVGLQGFNMSLIDDGHHLARELNQIRLLADSSSKSAEALDLRNRIATLLVDRMGLLRSTVCSVFRNFPAIVRLTASTFELRNRAPSSWPPDLEVGKGPATSSFRSNPG